MSEIITRPQAIALGLKRYRDGTACRHGHVGQRYTRDETCCVCAVARQRTFRALNPGASHRSRGPARRRKAQPVKIPLAEIKRISTFIAPPTRDQLMARR